MIKVFLLSEGFKKRGASGLEYLDILINGIKLLMKLKFFIRTM